MKGLVTRSETLSLKTRALRDAACGHGVSCTDLNIHEMCAGMVVVQLTARDFRQSWSPSPGCETLWSLYPGNDLPRMLLIRSDVGLDGAYLRPCNRVLLLLSQG